MSKGIDYSKWDHLDVSDDDEEEEQATPRVTAFDGPTRVTRQVDGTLIVEESKVTNERKVKKKSSKEKNDKIKKDPKLLEWSKKGDVLLDGKLYWSQDRYHVIMRYRLEAGLTGKDVQVDIQGVLPYSERTMAVGSTDLPHLAILVQGKPVLEGTLPQHVHFAQDEEEQIDWLVESVHDEKYIVITLPKATPMEGITLWWKQPLQHLPERSHDEDEALQASEKQEQFQMAWEEAHKQFRAKIKSKQSS